MTSSISVCVVNHNTCELLDRCLESLFATSNELIHEVFVADNNSTDGSLDMLDSKFPQVSVIRNLGDIGYTKAINPLLHMAKGKYYLLLHPDVEILPNTLKVMVEFFDTHPQAGILGANLYYPDGTPNPCEILFPGIRNDLLLFAIRFFKKLPGGRLLTGGFNPLEWSHKATRPVNCVWSACMLIRKEILEEIGHFDENFFIWYADWDLCKRAIDAGWSIYYVHPATAIHYERQSLINNNTAKEEVLYKLDSWHAFPLVIKDRCTFLKKHNNTSSILGVKTIYIVEYLLRLWLILANYLFQKANFKKTKFHSRACLETIRTVVKT